MAEDATDVGYHTPKNILNPAMFRLSEVTKALSEVNMKVDQEHMEKLLERNENPSTEISIRETVSKPADMQDKWLEVNSTDKLLIGSLISLTLAFIILLILYTTE